MSDDPLTYLFSFICHQLADRSLTINNSVMPLCARCTGIYSGFFISTLFQYARNRKVSQLPPLFITFSSIIAILLMILESIGERLYWWESTNDARFLMGLILGSAISVLLLPLFNFYLIDKNYSSLDKKFYVFLVLIVAAAFVFQYTPFSFHFFLITSTVGVLAIYIMASLSFASVLVSYRKKVSTLSSNRILTIYIGILLLIIEVFIFKTGK